jgi:hypothetical protein
VKGLLIITRTSDGGEIGDDGSWLAPPPPASLPAPKAAEPGQDEARALSLSHGGDALARASFFFFSVGGRGTRRVFSLSHASKSPPPSLFGENGMFFWRSVESRFDPDGRLSSGVSWAARRFSDVEGQK